MQKASSASQVSHPVEASDATDGTFGGDARSGGVTLRVVVLCLALAVFFGYIIPIIDRKLANTFLGAAHLPPGAIAVLLVALLILNPLLKLRSKRSGFSRNEILTIYISCLFSCLIPGRGGENRFVGSIVSPFYYATPENQWMEFLGKYVKPWLTPAMWADGNAYGEAGRRVVEPWYTGLPVGDHIIPWHAWLVPLLAWGSLILASYMMLGCLSVMLRAQWAEREALAFPLLAVPLEVTADVDRSDQYGILGRFFRNPMMWIGFGIAAGIQLVNGLNVYFPDVPRVPLTLDTGALFTEAPWNRLGWLPLFVWPMAVGITYLLSSEVAFSLWFFALFVRFQYIVAYYLGHAPLDPPYDPFTTFQSIGCYPAFAAFVLWTGREHLAHVVRRAFSFRHLPACEAEKKEALSYPVAFWGFVLSFVFITAWSVAAGMNVAIAIGMWLAYLVIAIALTRIVVEGGLIFLQGPMPLSIIAQFTGSGSGSIMGASTIVPGSMLEMAIMGDTRGFLMPSFMQSFKLAHDRKIKAKPLFALIMAVSFTTLLVSVWMNVRLGYEVGALSLDQWFAKAPGGIPATGAQRLITPESSQGTQTIWMGVGAVLTYGMMVARSRFLWFPFHPLGYLVSVGYPMTSMWFSIFLGWLCKGLILRFGGGDSYRRTRPAFLGLVLGDVVMMVVWLLVDGWQGRTGHTLGPG